MTEEGCDDGAGAQSSAGELVLPEKTVLGTWMGGSVTLSANT